MVGAPNQITTNTNHVKSNNKRKETKKQPASWILTVGIAETFLQGAHKLIRMPSAPGSSITETLGGGATSTAYTHLSRSIAGDISAPYVHLSRSNNPGNNDR